MPTDVLAAMKRRSAARKHEARQESSIILLISLFGALFTIFRAVQSEAFETALIAIGALE